ncbi:Uncharacterized protein FWK35_00000396 [Aphis craccivora]|uniref:Uncharacterized protein n=1 Tax=Aphis craccivora TaxID=307492 RepID=A0A6G0ZDR8_APHCR|nr:Uncharacterized protein FWK35_00000396 [Aphis craccivora]
MSNKATKTDQKKNILKHTIECTRPATKMCPNPQLRNKKIWASPAPAKKNMKYVNICMKHIITSRNNASISNYGGGFRCKSEYPWCIIQVKSKHFPTVFKKI